MGPLNYRHLWYFHEIARAGTLTEAAHRLSLSQSALSTQIRTLEDRLGHALFDRVGRRLELTEAGRITLAHAKRIFSVGQELLNTLDNTVDPLPPIRIGALSTLSRNFQIRFLKPLIQSAQGQMVLRSGTEPSLLDALVALDLDVVLTNAPPGTERPDVLLAQEIAEQPALLHGRAELMAHDSLTELLRNEGIILPASSAIRAEFLAVADSLGVVPRIVADVDDMAMIRLLAREGAGIAMAPNVVVADELAAGRLATAPFELNVSERFYAITVKRTFPHPLLDTLLKAAQTVAD